LPFWFDYFLASCLSGSLFFPFGSYKSRLVRDLVVRDLPFWFWKEPIGTRSSSRQVREEVPVGRYEKLRKTAPSSYRSRWRMMPLAVAEAAYIRPAQPLPLLVRDGTSHQRARTVSSPFWYEICPGGTRWYEPPEGPHCLLTLLVRDSPRWYELPEGHHVRHRQRMPISKAGYFLVFLKKRAIPHPFLT
jgi:hypothetical protein